MDVRTLKVKKPSDDRVFCIPQALKAGYSVEKIHSLTKIDSSFLHKIKTWLTLKTSKGKQVEKLSWPEHVVGSKAICFSDKQILRILQNRFGDNGVEEKTGNPPCVKQIDNLAAEVSCENNYLYLTYNATQVDIEFNNSQASDGAEAELTESGQAWSSTGMR